MCNAFRHPDDCECGFGPPYRGVINVGGGTEWAEEILDEPWLARQGLEELGWPGYSIKEFLAKYSEIRYSNALSRSGMVKRLKELLGRRHVVEEDTWTEVIRVPLFRFGAPRVEGASVRYSEGELQKRGASWWIKIFGVGTGNSHEFSYTTKHTYFTANGQCKEVFVPVRIRVAKVRVREDGEVVGRGLRAEVVLPKTKARCWVRGRGVQQLSPPRCVAPLGVRPEEAFDFSFAQDRTGHVHEAQRSWATDVSREVSLRLKKVVDVGPVARVSRKKLIAVELCLPSGHDYLGYRADGALWWDMP